MREVGPVRFFLGNTPAEVEAAKPYMGIARTQLGIMKALNPNKLPTFTRRVTLFDGTVITCQSIFGQDIIGIAPVVTTAPAESAQPVFGSAEAIGVVPIEIVPASARTKVMVFGDAPGNDTVLLVYDTSRSASNIVYSDAAASLDAIAMSPDGKTLLAMDYGAIYSFLTRRTGSWHRTALSGSAYANDANNDGQYVVGGGDYEHYANPDQFSDTAYVLIVKATGEPLIYQLAADRPVDDMPGDIPLIIDFVSSYYNNRGMTGAPTFDLAHYSVLQEAATTQGDIYWQVGDPGTPDRFTVGEVLQVIKLISESSVAALWGPGGQEIVSYGEATSISGAGDVIALTYQVSDGPQRPAVLVSGSIIFIGPTYGRALSISSSGQFICGNGGEVDSNASWYGFIHDLSTGATATFAGVGYCSDVSDIGVAVGTSTTAQALKFFMDGSTEVIAGMRDALHISADGRVISGRTTYTPVTYGVVIDGAAPVLTGQSSAYVSNVLAA